MKCRRARILAAYDIDHVLEAADKIALRTHLAGCRPCAGHFGSLAALRSQMRDLDSPTFPEELVSEILSVANHRQAASASRETETLLTADREWSSTRVRAWAMVASFLITVPAYLFLLNHLKLIPSWTVPGHGEPIAFTSQQFSDLNQQPVSGDRNGYTIPRIVSTARLEQSLRNTPDRSVVVITLVHSDGSASMMEVLSPRNRPDVTRQLTGAVQEISFRPATTSGKPVATQLILMVEKIDVRG